MDSTVTAGEVMDREFVGVSESDAVADTAELMLSTGRESVVVLRGREPVGVVTQRDALEALVADDGDAPVADAMRTDVPTLSPAATIAEAADVMSSQATGRVVVTDGAETLGVLDEHDLVATSPFGPDRNSGRRAADAGELVVDDRADDREESPTSGQQGFAEQSICEACGAFARDLATFNGQLLCGDCRDI